MNDRFSSASEKSLETLTGNSWKQTFSLTSAQRLRDVLLMGSMKSFYSYEHSAALSPPSGLDWLISVWENQDWRDQHADTKTGWFDENHVMWPSWTSGRQRPAPPSDSSWEGISVGRICVEEDLCGGSEREAAAEAETMCSSVRVVLICFGRSEHRNRTTRRSQNLHGQGLFII